MKLIRITLWFVVLIFSSIALLAGYEIADTIYTIVFHSEGFEITNAKVFYNQTNRSVYGYVYVNNTGRASYSQCDVRLRTGSWEEGYGGPRLCDYALESTEDVIPVGQMTIFNFYGLDPRSDKLCLNTKPLNVENIDKIKTIYVSCRIDQPFLLDWRLKLSSGYPERSYLKKIEIEVVG
ncbi:MAG: hypothetical protein PHG85_00945 [Candidatus Altiarchaeota archaeon]|nr:hypothetical protein [Candidatus Altiarchaeota archaeon]